MGKSVFLAFSARTGALLSFKSQFEFDVWLLAELDPQVKSYRMREPTFRYFDGKRERQGDFFLCIEKTDGGKELWNPTEDGVDLARPIEQARTTFSKLLEMDYRRIYRASFYANEVAVINRRTMVGVLSTNLGKQDTEEVEAALLSIVPAGESFPISKLSQQLERDFHLVSLAIFRLCAKGRLVGDHRRHIGTKWQVRRAT